MSLNRVAWTLFACMLLLGEAHFVAAQDLAAADPSFATGSGFDGAVGAIAVDMTGNIVVGGDFKKFNSVTMGALARLKSDGSLDPTFPNPVIVLSGGTPSVKALLIQPDGKIVIAGNFSMVRSVSRNRIARLNPDGSLDATFNPGIGFDGNVQALALQADGKIIAGGAFQHFGPTFRRGIARLNADGSLDAAFAPGNAVTTIVRALAVQDDGSIVVGGSFSKSVARLTSDGAQDPGFQIGTGFVGGVEAVMLDGNRSVWGGGMTTFDQVVIAKVARLTSLGTLDPSFNVGAGPAPSNAKALALGTNGRIVVGGTFTLFAGTTRMCIARLSADGALDPNFDPQAGFDGEVRALAVQIDGKILVGGNFTKYRGNLVNHIVRLMGDAGAGNCTATAGAESPACPGSTLHLSASPGVTHAWSGPSGFTSSLQNPTISNITAAAAGNYSVSVTNSLGCLATATVSVIVAGPTPIIGSNSPVCTGGELRLTASGGVSYAWRGPGNFASGLQNPTISNVAGSAAGFYEVTVTDANGCSTVGGTSVAVLPPPPASAANTGPACAGSNVTLTASGGVTFAWTGPNGFSTALQNPSLSGVTASAAGTYRVTVTDAQGCTGSATTILSVLASPIATAGNSGPVCVGDALTLTASGGTSFAWTGPNGFASSARNPTIPNVDATVAGTYRVTVTDDRGCTAAATTDVVVQPRPVATATNDGPACVGGTVTLSASGGASYFWTGPDGFASSDRNPVLSTVGPSSAGEYRVVVTDARGCSNFAATIVVIEATVPAAAGNSGPVCVGGNVTLTASGGTSYRWTGPNGFASPAQNPTISSVTASAAGDYEVTVTDARGCNQKATTTVVVHPLPTATASNSGPICAGSSLTLNASGGSSYAWTGPQDFASTQQNPVVANVSTSAAGTYHVVVTDEHGCLATASTSVTVHPAPSASAGNSGPVCSGRSASLTASGGTSYSWTGPGGFSSNLQNPVLPNVTAASGGAYQVTVTDARGCSSTATTILTVLPSPVATAANSGPVCAGTPVTLTATGGVSYRWVGPGGFTSNAQNPQISNPTATGSYTVTVTDANGCTATATTVVVVRPLPTVSAHNSGPVCEGDPVTLTASGGSTYSWTGPNNFASNLQNPSISSVSPSAEGTYQIRVTDAFGCTNTATTYVDVHPSPTVTVASDAPICVGNTLTLRATGGATYVWTGPNGYTSTAQNPSISNVTTSDGGTYRVIVTDTNGCSKTASISVQINPDREACSRVVVVEFPHCVTRGNKSICSIATSALCGKISRACRDCRTFCLQEELPPSFFSDIPLDVALVAGRDPIRNARVLFRGKVEGRPLPLRAKAPRLLPSEQLWLLIEVDSNRAKDVRARVIFPR